MGYVPGCVRERVRCERGSVCEREREWCMCRCMCDVVCYGWGRVVMVRGCERGWVGVCM